MLFPVKFGERGGWRDIMIKWKDVIVTRNRGGFCQTFTDPDDRLWKGLGGGGVKHLMLTGLLHHATLKY
jgi:hypothetical protein